MVLVAEDVNDHKIIGYSCFSTDANEYADAELISLYIDKNYSRQGVGTSLLRETIKKI